MARLAHLLRHRYIVGMISDTIPAHTRVNARRGIFRYFRPLILSHRVHLCKPHSAIFRHAIGAAGVKPYAAVFIDDLEKNVLGAQRIGMHGILFKSATQLKRDLAKLGIVWK